MGIKVEIESKNKESEIKFPCLMISKNGERLVLMFKANDNYGEGVCFAHYYSCNLPVFYSETWDMPNFKVFEGKLILENEE